MRALLLGHHVLVLKDDVVPNAHVVFLESVGRRLDLRLVDQSVDDLLRAVRLRQGEFLDPVPPFRAFLV